MTYFMNLRRATTQLLIAGCIGLASIAAFSPGVIAQSATTGVVSVPGSRLNVRSGPGLTYPVVGQLTAGATVTVLEQDAAGAWLKISADGAPAEAWVSSRFVVVDAGAPAPAVSAPAEVAPAQSAAPADAEPVAVVVPARMNVRGGPGTNYGIVGSAARNQRLPITGVNQAGDWYRVQVAGVSDQGWVFGGLVVTSGNLDGVARLSGEDVPAAPAAAVASPAPAAAVAAPAPSGGGGFNYGVTAQMWQSDPQGVANQLKEIGFPWVKQQVRWEFVEPAPGAVNWQEMDAIINAMNGNGVNVAFSVVTSPAWTRPNKGGTNGPPEDFQLFANFLGAVAGRYCGQSLKAIEVWNEQNLQREWEGYPLDPGLYMDLLRRSYGAIKAACPGMIVISGATTPAGYSDVAFDDIDYLRGMYQNGLARYADGVGIHPSGFANPPSVRFQDWQSGSYDAPSHVNHRSFYFLSTLEESRNVMVQFGDTGKRLWPTEFGWGSTPSPHPGYEYEGRISEAQQAQWIVDAYRIMANSGYVGVAFLWNLNYNYGEMAAFAVSGRPAYQALKSLTGR